MSALALASILAVKRETAMIAAFGSVVVSGLIVSIGAWILLSRERRATRRDKER
jgi:predicted exporter